LQEDEFDIEVQPTPPAFPAYPKKEDEKQDFSESGKEFPDQQRIDEFIEMLLSENSDLAKALTKIIEPVINLVEQSESLEEIKEKLGAQFPDMNSKQFEKALRKVLFIAENFGRLSVEEEA
jgi:phage gp29-like protein